MHYLSASMGLSMVFRVQQMLGKLVSKLFLLVPYLRFKDCLDLMSQRRAYLELFLEMLTHCRDLFIFSIPLYVVSICATWVKAENRA